MDYRGTKGDDKIDQKAMGLPDGTNIFGDEGNDTITIGTGNAIGGPGNDTIIGTTQWAAAAYWDSPTGIDANLASGVVKDGFGTIDTLVNVRTISDSTHDDKITGSSADETFWLSGGNDIVVGGGGNDQVNLYNVKSTEVAITYAAGTDTFSIAKHLPNGDTGNFTLTGIKTINFIGTASDNTIITSDMFDRSSGFLRDRVVLPLTNPNFIQQMRTGDFNGDGKLDILISRAAPDAGLTAQPLQVLVGDGHGHFTDQTAALFKNGIPYVNYVPRIFTADFNKDGISDIFNPDFGLDAPPYPGGQNSLYLSNKATGQLSNETATLPQALLQNHGTSIGDINSDGYPDILVNALNERTGNASQLLVNDGTGHFKVSQQLLPASLTQPVFTAGNTWSLLKDLNNDGYADMVLGTWDVNGKPSQVYLNDGHGSFATSVPIDLPRSGINSEVVIGIETIDLNGDKLPDLVLSVTNGGDHNAFYQVPYLQFLINDGSGKFHDDTQARLPQPLAKQAGAANAWYLSATPVDLNGDGFPDIVADGSGGGPSKIFLNDGTGKFSLFWESGRGTKIVVGDFDGDGAPDLATTTETSGLSILYNVLPRAIGASHEYHATAHGDTVKGGAANEKIFSGAGNDNVDGGAGIDTMVFAGKRADYTLARSAAGYAITDTHGLDGTDTVMNIERLQFADMAVALEINGTGGQAYRLYQAAFNRAPDAAGLGFQMWAMDEAKVSLTSVAQGFIDSAEFKQTYGALDNRAFVTQLYANVLHRAPDDAGLAWHVSLLNNGTISRADDLVVFSESAENQAALIGTIQNGMPYLPYH
jgi:hypothetical protein